MTPQAEARRLREAAFAERKRAKPARRRQVGSGLSAPEARRIVEEAKEAPPAIPVETPAQVAARELRQAAWTERLRVAALDPRKARGSNRKLDPDKVRRIRAAAESGEYTQTEIAAAEGVSQVAISNIHTGDTWAWVE